MSKFKIITAIILLISISTTAQITKGNWMVGGTASFTSSSYESTTNNNNTSSGKGIGIILSPTFGYFIIDKLALGISPTFGYTKTDGGNDSTSYGIGPFIRYYLLKPEKRINVLTNVSYYYGTNNANTTSDNLNFKAGPVIFLNSSVALELTLNYNIGQFKSDSSVSTFKSFNFGLGFQIHLEKDR